MSKANVCVLTVLALSVWPGEIAAQEPVPTAVPATVIVEWTTESEVNLAGFNLYRSDDPLGPYTKVNNGLIPASPDPVTGRSYVYTDSTVIAGGTYYYRLADVELDGSSTMHGPIAVVAGANSSPLGVDIGRLVAMVLSAGLVGITVFGLLRRRRAGRSRRGPSSLERGEG